MPRPHAPQVSRALRGGLAIALSTAVALASIAVSGPPARASAPITVAHVSSTGIDGDNDCSSAASPCATVSHALTKTGSGATIWVSGVVHDHIQIPGSTATTTIIGVADSNATLDGQHLDRVIDTDAPLVLENITIRHGRILSGQWGGMGAGVRSTRGSLTLRRATVTGNHAAYGAGVFKSEPGSLTVVDSVVSHNTATVHAAGVWTRVPTTITRSVIDGNESDGDAGGVSAGDSLLTVVDSTLTGNRAARGGALSGVNMVVAGSTFNGNWATFGSALNMQTGSAKVFSSTIAGNTGGRAVSTGFGEVAYAGTILARNSGGGCESNNPGSLISLGHNLGDDATCDLSGPGDQASTPAQLGPLADNGGQLLTMRPATTSPAVDRIPVGTVVEGHSLCERVDQRGMAGPVAGATKCAVGAVEPVDFAFREQEPLRITSAGGAFNVPVPLTTAGGTGRGNVTFTAVDGTASGCRILPTLPPSLVSDDLGTCEVTAVKASHGGYRSVTSPRATLTQTTGVQAPLRVTSTSGPAGFALALSSEGGSGSGAVSYAVTNGTATGCRVSAASLLAESEGTCLVTAHRAGDSRYQAAQSPATAVTLVKRDQEPLALTSLAAVYGQPLALTTIGGSGTGAMTYYARRPLGDGLYQIGTCVIEDGKYLVAHHAGICEVTATKSADAEHRAVSSPPTDVMVAHAPQAPLTVSFVEVGWDWAAISSGGSGMGRVHLTVVDGTARGCGTYDRGDGHQRMTSETPGTCIVTATKDGDFGYLPTTSEPVTFRMPKFHQDEVFLASVRGVAGTPLTLEASGGSGTGAYSFLVFATGATMCRISGSAPAVLHASAAGTCRVVATRAGDDDYHQRESSITDIVIAEAPRPGKVGKIKVSGSPKASTRTITWTGPRTGGTVTSYQVLITKGRKRLVSKVVSAPRLAVKRKRLATGRLTVTVTARNDTGSGAKVTRKFTVR
ncbi:choice-of-anchor Q domain-containing protein [Nocardioides ochotonae]|uniref:choice-of-anchor Q domain-containing protein n=1 Tax=Nocardioides ochotonae TaxID=2685869 RepID=UPI001407A9E8